MNKRDERTTKAEYNGCEIYSFGRPKPRSQISKLVSRSSSIASRRVYLLGRLSLEIAIVHTSRPNLISPGIAVVVQAYDKL